MAIKQIKLLTSRRISEIYTLLIKSKLTESSIKIIKDNEDFCLNILNEALTHTSKNSHINHERLEFHGDAVLRLAATEYIEDNFPTLKVGERSELRSQLVSDEWLARIGEKIGIINTMDIASKVIKDEAAKNTICAEATEALIGGLYKCFENIKLIEDWLSQYWDIESKKVLNDPYKQNVKSALQEWSQGHGFSQPKYKIEEISQKHGDLKRFYCKVFVNENLLGEGWGSSIKNAEKASARSALNNLNS